MSYDLDNTTHWQVDELVTADLLNTHLRDNLNALKSPPSQQAVRDNEAAYSTTSTSFVVVDGTNLKITLTTTGGDVLVRFTGTAHADSTSGRQMSFDVQVDETEVVGRKTRDMRAAL